MHHLNLSPEIHSALSEMGITTPSFIQEQAIPLLMEGKDVIGQAQTGTGKTAAFAIPLIEKIDTEDKRLQAIILCPTRELALQVTGEIQKIGKYKRKLRSLAIYGGQPIQKQLKGLKANPQVVIGTTGRVLDMIRREAIKLNAVNMVVLDEADEMLNMGFRPDIEHILDLTPDTRQTVFFSATMPRSILELTSQYQQQDSVHIKVTAPEQNHGHIEQYYCEVQRSNKFKTLTHLLEDYGLERALIFCNTKNGVDMISGSLKTSGYSADALHGGKTQSQRDRIMTGFRKGKTKLLVATDVAARGLDVNDLEAVFNYDMPSETEFYIHRIGRTGRAGRKGQAFTFVERHEQRQLRLIRKAPNVNLLRLDSPVEPGQPKQNDSFYEQAVSTTKHRLPRPPRRPRRPRVAASV